MKLTALLIAASLALATTPVFAADLVTAKNPQTVLDALTAAGYPGKLDKLGGGNPSIGITVAGEKAFIDFYDCADDNTDCLTLLFNVGLHFKNGTTLDKANGWNSKEVTGRVWLNSDLDPIMDFSLTTGDGVSADVFNQNVELFATKIGQLKTYFGM